MSKEKNKKQPKSTSKVKVVVSAETRAKISASAKGRKPWNAGLKKNPHSPSSRMTKGTVDDTVTVVIERPEIKPLAPVSPRNRLIVTWQANTLQGAEQLIAVTGQMTMFTGKTVERAQELVIRLVESHFHQLGVIGADNCRIQIVSTHTAKKEK